MFPDFLLLIEKDDRLSEVEYPLRSTGLRDDIVAIVGFDYVF